MSQQRNPGEGLIKAACEIFTEETEEAPYASFSEGLGPGGPGATLYVSPFLGRQVKEQP